MSLDYGERINHRGSTFEHFGQGSERGGWIALYQMHRRGGIANLAAAGSFRRQGGERSARLFKHPESGLYGDRPATDLRGQRVLSDHQRLHPFRGAEFLQCRAQVAAADVQHAGGEVKQELGTWLRISMGRARGAL